MVKRVIKKSGKKQKFSSTKIKKSIKKAATQAKIPSKIREDIANKIIEGILLQLEKFDEVTTAKIRDIVFKYLDEIEPAVLKAWIAYEMKKLTKIKKII